MSKTVVFLLMSLLGFVVAISVGVKILFFSGDIKTVSNIPGVSVSLGDKGLLLKELNSWKVFGSGGLGEYPVTGLSRFHTLRSLEVFFTSSPQQYGLSIAEGGSNNIIISYGIDFTKSKSRLSIYLNRDYWFSLNASDRNRLLSSYLMSYLYEVSHYPPKEQWKDLDISRKKVFDKFNTNFAVPMFILNSNDK